MNAQKLIAAAAGAVFLFGAAAAANAGTVGGSYNIVTSGLTGNSPSITDELAPNGGTVLQGQGHTAGTSSSIGFAVNPTVNGAAQTDNFIQWSPDGSSGLSGGCGTSCIVSEAVKVNFTFTDPTGNNGTFSVNGEYYANYTGPLDGVGESVNCDPGDSESPNDCIVWNNTVGDPNPFTVNFGDGYALTVTLNNQADWTITNTITFDLTQSTGGHQTVPEPASMVLFASGLLGLPVVRRRLRRKTGHAA